MRVHHFILSNDPYTDWLRINGVAGRELGSAHEVTSTITPYDHERLLDLVARGGFTHHPFERDPKTTGFSVGLDPAQGAVGSVHRLRRFSPGHIANHREAAGQLFQHGWNGEPVYQGGWVDTDDRKVYLDTSHVTDDEGHARHLALAHHQKAYYDLATHRTTYFDPLHDPVFRGEEGRSRQAEQVSHYAALGKRFGAIKPEEYESYEHLYPLPHSVKDLRFVGAREYRKGRALGLAAGAQAGTLTAAEQGELAERTARIRMARGEP